MSCARGRSTEPAYDGSAHQHKEKAGWRKELRGRASKGKSVKEGRNERQASRFKAASPASEPFPIVSVCTLRH